MKEQLYICCKKDDPRCTNCFHSEPHEKRNNPCIKLEDDVCTTWGDCFEEDGNTFKVRCVKIK